MSRTIESKVLRLAILSSNEFETTEAKNKTVKTPVCLRLWKKNNNSDLALQSLTQGPSHYRAGACPGRRPGLSITASLIFALEDMPPVTQRCLPLREERRGLAYEGVSKCCREDKSFPQHQVVENAFVQTTSRHGDGRL